MASYHCAPMTVSMESAMMSLDCSEKLMPDVPMEIPSLTPDDGPPPHTPRESVSAADRAWYRCIR